ncbi:hypothetical protein [Bradyrhizobium sp. CCBAU 21360]|uniref:hypothetical protein n=1 Tax=Bradyrhizobium sp. CCBAU 21360 TaxID=1325081 RepID=UPI0023057273|nr:hypothetical protein [Bradyrhizobium sp. CCBAU 21360]
MRESWNQDDLGLLFSSPLYTGCQSPYKRHLPGSSVSRDALYWVPLVVTCTGLRLSEICQLQVRHLKRDDVTGIWFIDLFDRHIQLLHASQKRRVPLPNALLELNIVSLLHIGRERVAPLFDLGAKPFDRGGEVIAERFKRYCSSFDSAQQFETTVALHKSERGLQSLRSYFYEELRGRGVAKRCAETLLGNQSEPQGICPFGDKLRLEVLKQEIERAILPINIPHLASIPERIE